MRDPVDTTHRIWHPILSGVVLHGVLNELCAGRGRTRLQITLPRRVLAQTTAQRPTPAAKCQVLVNLGACEWVRMLRSTKVITHKRKLSHHNLKLSLEAPHKFMITQANSHQLVKLV